MEHVGLVFVGVILLLNGLSAAGMISGRSTIPLNFLVGLIQLVLPTVVLIQAAGNIDLIAAAWPSYLFGITYLWVCYSLLTGVEETGFGWYCLFVAGIALYQVVRLLAFDPLFSVIWLCWAVAWFLLFWKLALGRESFAGRDTTRFTGWFLILTGIPSSTVPALLLMGGIWPTSGSAALVALVLLLLAGVVAARLARRAPLLDQPPTPLLPSTS